MSEIIYSDESVPLPLVGGVRCETGDVNAVTDASLIADDEPRSRPWLSHDMYREAKAG